MKALSYLEDIYPRHLLYAITIRSPIAKGILRNIDFPEMPEDCTLITAKDIPGKNKLENTEMPILAEKELNYIGEPVALLLGHEKTKLEELASKCIVIADEEKSVFTCLESNEDPAVVREIQIGDPLGIFHKEGRIVAGSYVTGIQAHWYAEPAGAVTYYDEGKNKNSNLIVKTGTQWPYHVKRSVAVVLGIEADSVAVEPTPLGLHMDGKIWFPSLISCHAALGTFITKKPVRLILNREEDFFFTPKRCHSNIDIASKIDENGNMTATEIDIYVNLGAYGVNSEEILDQVCLGSIGYYNVENLKITAKANRTNIPPQGPFSGFGLSQGFFAMERHVSMIADMVHEDPARWRNRNIHTGTILPSGSSVSKDFGERLIGKTAQMSDYYRKWASYELLRQDIKGSAVAKGEKPRGIGIAAGFQGNGLLYNFDDKTSHSVEVTLTKKNQLEIKTSICSSEDYKRIWVKVASNIISISPDNVFIIAEDSPDCGPSCSSRNITAITKVVEMCIQEINEKRVTNPLPITVRKSIQTDNGALFNGHFKPHEGKEMDISGFSKLGMACAVVEVSIDLVQCTPKIRGVWLGVDGGKIVSVNRAKRSLTRNAVQALGWAFTENIEYKDGAIPSSQYDNFSIPFPVDMPPINIDFISDDSEIKGIGELPFTCIPAAFIQAVSQAMDHSFKSIPLKRKEIWEMVRLRNSETYAQGKK